MELGIEGTLTRQLNLSLNEDAVGTLAHICDLALYALKLNGKQPDGYPYSFPDKWGRQHFDKVMDARLLQRIAETADSLRGFCGE